MAGVGRVQPAGLLCLGLAVLLPRALPLVPASPRPGQDGVSKGVEARPGLFRELQLAPEQLLGAAGAELRGRAALSPPGLAPLFQALSCRGSPGVLCQSSHCSSSVGFYFIMFSVSPLCCCFSFRAETEWSPCC